MVSPLSNHSGLIKNFPHLPPTVYNCDSKWIIISFFRKMGPCKLNPVNSMTSCQIYNIYRVDNNNILDVHEFYLPLISPVPFVLKFHPKVLGMCTAEVKRYKRECPHGGHSLPPKVTCTSFKPIHAYMHAACSQTIANRRL